MACLSDNYSKGVVSVFVSFGSSVLVKDVTKIAQLKLGFWQIYHLELENKALNQVDNTLVSLGL